MKLSVMVVEDDAVTGMALERLLKSHGCTVIGPCAHGDTALKIADLKRPDVALLDIRLAGWMNGILTARSLSESYRIPLIFITGQDTPERWVEAMALKPLAYLLKPLNESQLLEILEEIEAKLHPKA